MFYLLSESHLWACNAGRAGFSSLVDTLSNDCPRALSRFAVLGTDQTFCTGEAYICLMVTCSTCAVVSVDLRHQLLNQTELPAADTSPRRDSSACSVIQLPSWLTISFPSSFPRKTVFTNRSPIGTVSGVPLMRTPEQGTVTSSSVTASIIVMG